MDNQNVPARLAYVEFQLFQVHSALGELSQQTRTPAIPQAVDNVPPPDLQIDVEKQNNWLIDLERRFEEMITTFADFKASITPLLPNKVAPTPEDLQNQINELRGILIRLMDRVNQIAMESSSRSVFETAIGDLGSKGKRPYEEPIYEVEQSPAQKKQTQGYVEGTNSIVTQPLQGPQKRHCKLDLPHQSCEYQKPYIESVPKPTKAAQIAPKSVGPKKKSKQFTPLPQLLSKLLPMLLEKRLIVKEVPRYNAPKLKGYDENKSCAYHMGEKGHSTDDCAILKIKVQKLIDNGLLDFKETESNIQQNTSSKYQGVDLVYVEEEEDRLDFSVGIPKIARYSN